MKQGSVDRNLLEAAGKSVLQLVAKAAQPLALCRHFALTNLASLAQAYRSGNIQRTRPHAALMSASVDHRRYLHARILAPHIEHADAFGAVDLVRGNRQQVNAVFFLRTPRVITASRSQMPKSSGRYELTIRIALPSAASSPISR